MAWIRIETDGGANAFLPGETITGTVSWQLDPPLTNMELRLIWYTEGKGDQDLQIVETAELHSPGVVERRGFTVRVPQGPYSFSGKLISILWALEVVAQPKDRASRVPIIVSPTRREIVLQAQAPE
ncbi:MAG TPA: hypothetical protein VIW92_14025 [Thermoanaerobaculia bacterium]